MNPARRAEIFARLQALNPEPTTELEYGSPFELLVAVILSAQATDRSVNLATRELFRVANTPAAIAALGVGGLSGYVRTIGLYPSKARHIVQACAVLLAEHGGEVPHTREALERLPGVGRKTANVVLNTAFGEPTIAVDTHVFRVSNRTGIARGRTPLEVEQRLLRVVPKQYLRNCHHWLILHGRHLCKAVKPECWRCPIVDLCDHRGKTPAPAAHQPRG
ncbi:MAG: endonuclease III [Burkholderiales bacterium]|nr:MAG: endonuclease III [Burkholderiales bacterium]